VIVYAIDIENRRVPASKLKNRCSILRPRLHETGTKSNRDENRDFQYVHMRPVRKLCTNLPMYSHCAPFSCLQCFCSMRCSEAKTQEHALFRSQKHALFRSQESRTCIVPKPRACIVPKPRACIVPKPRACIVPKPRACIVPKPRDWSEMYLCLHSSRSEFIPV
jgi:hypothetical protein